MTTSTPRAPIKLTVVTQAIAIGLGTAANDIVLTALMARNTNFRETTLPLRENDVYLVSLKRELEPGRVCKVAPPISCLLRLLSNAPNSQPCVRSIMADEDAIHCQDFPGHQTA
jgi:hypothetical protein